MATVTIDPRDVPAMIEETNRGMLQAIQRGGNRGAERGRTFIAKKTPVDLGQLKASWYVWRGYEGSGAIPMVQGVRELVLAELRNTAPHAGIVELGARPHPVSPEGWAAIYEWARRHFGFQTRPGGRMHRIGGDVGDDPFLTELTWAIVYKIQREGQKPTYFVRENLPTLRQILHTEILRAVAQFNPGRPPRRGRR
jgi:hypothetical protein